ncbi:Sec20-domain-containing protein [Rhodofomes roseus]|uniref:Sec20-domain-containing protein n=1 Tax=Rhodofomes roseus TaxID=34475 RepID=A0ABQ8K7V0_9APHY|nr:Sec20-domain-containing protein [Rhodofomes roseus]KAH9833336.1 Sec20-domain-containing protein [Rhodofomes roseus]
MPPLPSTLNEEIVSTIESLRRRRKDLSEFQIQRLRTCTGPLGVQQQYAAELREDLDAFTRQVESLELSVDDQRTERDRRELWQVVDEFRADLASLKKDTRAALLASKRAIDANQLSNRDELLRSSAVTEKQDLSEKVVEDALMKANNDVTEALQRTIALMQGELEKSVLSTQLLDASSSSLRSTSSTHDVLDGLLVTSKHLITALEKSDWLDRLLVLAGLAFFILVVVFILKQRIVDRGLRIAFWWTRFIPDFSGDERLLDVEEAKATASAVMGTAASVAASISAATVSASGNPSSSLSAVVSPSVASEPPTSRAKEEASTPLETLLDTLLASSTSAADGAKETGLHDEL